MASLALGSVPAQADVIDPAEDFLATYMGPQNGDLDALACPDERTLTSGP